MDKKLLYIFIEGDTEENVIKDFLKPFWEKRFSKCVVIRYKGSGRLKNNYARDAKKRLNNGDAVLVLLDLKNDPFGVWRDKTEDPAEAFVYLQQRLLDGIPGSMHSEYFGAFPVIVEVETWLLADLAMQNPSVKHKYPAPETVPNPVEVLKKYRDYKHYAKGEQAVHFFKRANPLRIYADRCPHFVRLADWLSQGIPTQKLFEPTPQELERQQRLSVLTDKYNELTLKIKASLKHGETDGAKLLRLERAQVDREISTLYQP